MKRMSYSLDSVGSNSDAEKIAIKLGFRGGIHQLKEEFIRPGDGSLYDLKYDKHSKELFLVRKDGAGQPISTGLKMP